MAKLPIETFPALEKTVSAVNHGFRGARFRESNCRMTKPPFLENLDKVHSAGAADFLAWVIEKFITVRQVSWRQDRTRSISVPATDRCFEGCDGFDYQSARRSASGFYVADCCAV